MSNNPSFVPGFCVTQEDLDVLLCYLQSARDVGCQPNAPTTITLPGALVTYELGDRFCHDGPIQSTFNGIAPSFRERRGDTQTLHEINTALRFANAGFGPIDTLATAFSEDPIAAAFAYGLHHGLSSGFSLDPFLEKGDIGLDETSPTADHLILAVVSGAVYGYKNLKSITLSNENIRRALDRSDQQAFHVAALDLFITGYRGVTVDDVLRLQASQTKEYLPFERRMRQLHYPQGEASTAYRQPQA